MKPKEKRFSNGNTIQRNQAKRLKEKPRTRLITNRRRRLSSVKRIILTCQTRHASAHQDHRRRQLSRTPVDDGQSLASILRDAIMTVLKTQELAGIDLITDGELTRFDPTTPKPTAWSITSSPA